MRIIAGEYSSRKLETLKNKNTRPTLDKVREAVFSSLGGMFDGGAVLDLYAGSGACGFEALSRGMDQAVLVDISRAACGIIKKNAASLRCEDRCRIFSMADRKALDLLAQEGVCFDLVYLDPPYEKQRNDEVMAYLNEHSLVKPGGKVVIESLKEDNFADAYGDLKFTKESVYGIMKVRYYKNEAV